MISICVNEVLTTAFQLLIASVYRLYLRSLARYPGPFLCRISILPSLYCTWTGDRHLVVNKLHKAYDTLSQGHSMRLQRLTRFHGRQGSAARAQSDLDMYSERH